VKRIVARIRAQWPQVEVVLRGDGGFSRDAIISWCEDHQVDYGFGLAKNKRLVKIIGRPLHEARLQFEATKQPARVFSEFSHQTRKSWKRPRCVVAKAEHFGKGSQSALRGPFPGSRTIPTRALYEELYCARGEMENRIKKQQLALFADRTSTELMRSNQLRLYYSTFADQLMQGLRRLGTEGHGADAGTVPDHPAEVTQDRSADSGDGAARWSFPGGWLSVPGDLREGVCQSDDEHGLRRHRREFPRALPGSKRYRLRIAH
jgi:hypothetical protein